MADQKEEALITLTIKSTKQKFDIDILPSEKVSKVNKYNHIEIILYVLILIFDNFNTFFYLYS